MQTLHGGDLYAASQRYPGKILDFSVNLNPLGPLASVISAAERGLRLAHQYPDPQCRQLCKAIGSRDGVEAQRVFCGNGASELIFRLAMALRPKTALITAPTFSEYEAALSAVSCEIQFYPLTAQHRFDPQPDLLDRITPELDLVLLCSPNNPTGRSIPPALLDAILSRCKRTGTTLILDECFLELCDHPQGLADKLASHPELILLRAFTKSYAIPGLRLGYCLCGDPSLPERLAEAGPCWSVSWPAQLAGLACCEERDYPFAGRRLITQEKPFLTEALTALGGEVVASQASFLLFRLPGETQLKEKLLEEGILIRSCGNYHGLGADWYRVAVRTHEENETLLRALNRALGGTTWQR